MTTPEVVGLLCAAIALIGFILTIVMSTAKLGKMAGSLETGLMNQNMIIGELKDEMISLRKVITDMAVFNSRMESHERQFTSISLAIDELRHGKGFVTPFDKT